METKRLSCLFAKKVSRMCLIAFTACLLSVWSPQAMAKNAVPQAQQKKASIIGAIETIKPEELKFGTTRTLSNNLAGKISGVIVITTKHGQIGAPSVKFHVEHSINQPTMFPEFLNAPDYMTLLNELAAQDGFANLPFTQQQIDRTRSGYDPDLYPDVNWIDAITKDYAYTSRANVDVSGGSDFLRYSICSA